MIRGLAEPGHTAPASSHTAWACKLAVEGSKGRAVAGGLLTCRILTWTGSPRSLWLSKWQEEAFGGCLGGAGESGAGPWAHGPRPSRHVLLFAAGPVLQPLGRHLMEQGKGGPALLALASSEHNLDNESWRMAARGRPTSRASALPPAALRPADKGSASHVSIPSPSSLLPHGRRLQNSGFWASRAPWPPSSPPSSTSPCH